MARARHPIKEIENVLRHAEECGWRIKVGGSHAWGRMYCPLNSGLCRCGEFCMTSVYSTPRNVYRHVRELRLVIDNCDLNRIDDEPPIEIFKE
ncbi:hypothetical protein ACL9RJ_10820 [Pseudomonas sp. Mn2068]|uniref:hypothetical protein n=1 Tax=unclassified Pseudomonas TaxID=196821 RepID=UPI001FD065B3|nr:hypothetical protein [Pseudomonas sp. Ost2]